MPAQITLNVATFVANSSATPTAPFCTLRPFGAAGGSTPGVAITDASDGNGNGIGFDPDDASTLWLQKGRNSTGDVGLCFTIACSGNTLNPKAIVLTQNRGNGAGNPNNDPSGARNFGSATFSGTQVTFSGKCLNKGNAAHGSSKNAPKWKLAVRVQDSATGNFGWIDPDMENSDDMLV